MWINDQNDVEFNNNRSHNGDQINETEKCQVKWKIIRGQTCVVSFCIGMLLTDSEK